jgi:hypothetical protein
MELLEETVDLEHPHIHRGHQQHQLVEADLMQAEAAEDQYKFSIQQQQVQAAEHLVVGP